jgi:hypothetical protein
MHQKSCYLVSPKKRISFFPLGPIPNSKKLLAQSVSHVSGGGGTFGETIKTHLYTPFSDLVGILLGLRPFKSCS